MRRKAVTGQLSDVGRGGQRRAAGHKQSWGPSREQGSEVSRCLIFFMEEEIEQDRGSKTLILGRLEGGKHLLTWHL